VFAPGAGAPAFGVLPVPLEEEGDAALGDLFHHDAAAVFIALGVAEGVGGGGEAAFAVIGVADEWLALEGDRGDAAFARPGELERARGGVGDANEVAAVVVEGDG